MGSRSPRGRGAADRSWLRPGSQHPPEGNKEPHRGFKQKYHDQACVLYRSLLQRQAEKSLKASTVCGRVTKAGATTPIQAGSAEALKALKHMMGGRGRVRRTLGGGLTGAEREGSLKGDSQLPCMGAREEDASRHRERGPCRRGFGNALHSLPPARVNWVSLLCTSHCSLCLLN